MKYTQYSIVLSTVTVLSQHITAFQPSLPSGNQCNKRNSSVSSLAQTSVDDISMSRNPINRRDAFSQVSKAASIITASTSFNPLVVHADGDEITSQTPISSKVPTVQLGKSNLEVSRTIQGYWQLAGGHGKYNIDDAIKNMEAHYRAGITTLDTADIYGPSEQIMGKFIEKTPGAVPCTKFCCFRYLDEIDKSEVRDRINKVSRFKM